VPIHPIEPLASGEVDPVVDGRLAYVEPLGDLVLRLATSDGRNDGSAAGGLRITLLMATFGNGCGFSVQDIPD
jgi:hypothetical protein